MITLAVLFLVVLFLIKNTSIFKNSVNFIRGNNQEGLVYGTAKVGDLISKDTDRDGVLDWEEALMGLDPTKKETVPGVPDNTTASKLRTEKVDSADGSIASEENLTQTDKFSRELLSTITSLGQNGAMDQDTIEQISTSLADKIQSSVQRKVFTTGDLKIINDNTTKAIQNYKNTLNAMQKKYPDNGDVLDILQRFIIDENTIDVTVLGELDPIIIQAQKMRDDILKMSVPQSLAPLHLNVLNGGQKLVENLSDIRLFDTDPILAMGAISVCEENINSFQSASISLVNAINKKLNI